jgi:hypothetical protein
MIFLEKVHCDGSDPLRPQTMMYKPRCLVVVVVVCSLLLLDLAGATEEKGSIVELMVVDMFGASLGPVAQVEEIGAQSGTVVTSWSRGTTRGVMSSGVHRLRVHVQGFRSETVDVNVEHSPVFLVVGMKLGSVSGEDPRVRVRGRLLHGERGARRWVRAAPLFAREISEAKVDDAGHFSFERLDAGKYLFQVMLNGSLICSSLRDVVGNQLDVVINLNKCS